ncbi:Uncharacterised protein [Klebsiella pneumoniae]|uniref:Uncharacterized protein n=1 Tax=Klebsiella pneumoniae TaxID=573 RepID=A0A377TN98_KLEPN|nr:Uncharacterised protein [Klebsiella pneumoniae]
MPDAGSLNQPQPSDSEGCINSSLSGACPQASHSA